MNLLFQMFGAKLPFPAGSQDHLWFYYTNNNRTFMLDGQGVTAEVVEPDIGATNGVIHVIDRILGVPQHTIGQKLAMDPMLSSVYRYGFTKKLFRSILRRNKPENLFQSYDLPKIQPSKVQKPETGQKTGSRTKKLFSKKSCGWHNKIYNISRPYVKF